MARKKRKSGITEADPPENGDVAVDDEEVNDFETVLNFDPNGLLVVEADSRQILWANKAAEKLLRKKREKLFSEPFPEELEDGPMRTLDLNKKANPVNWQGQSAVLLTLTSMSAAGASFSIEWRLEAAEERAREAEEQVQELQNQLREVRKKASGEAAGPSLQSLKDQEAELKAELQRSQERIETLEQDLRKTETRAEQWEERFHEAETLMEEAESQSRETERHLEDLNDNVRCVEEQLEAANQALKASEKQVQVLTAELAGARSSAADPAELQGLREQADALQVEINELMDKVAEQEQLALDASTQVGEKEREVEGLRGQLKGFEEQRAQWQQRESEIEEMEAVHLQVITELEQLREERQSWQESQAAVQPGELEELQEKLRETQERVDFLEVERSELEEKWVEASAELEKAQAVLGQLAPLKEQLTEMEGRLTAAQDECSQVQVDLATAQEQSADLETQLIEVRAQLAEARSQFESSGELARELEGQFADAQLEVADLTEKNGELTAARDALQIELDELKAELTDREQASGSFEEEKARLNEAAGQQEHRVHELEALLLEAEQMLAQSQARQGELEHLEHDYQDVQQHLVAVEKERDNLLRRLDKAEAEVEAGLAKLGAKEEETEAVGVALSDLETQLNELQDEYDSFKSQSRSREAEWERARQELLAGAAAGEANDQQLADLQRQLEQAQQQSQQFQQQLLSTQETISQLEQHTHQLEEQAAHGLEADLQLEDMRQQLAQAQQQVEELGQQLVAGAELAQQLAGVSEENRQLQERLEQLQKQVESGGEQTQLLEELNQQLASAQEQNEYAQLQLEELQEKHAQQLEELRQQLASAGQEADLQIEEARAQLAAAGERHEQTEQQLAELRTQLSASGDEQGQQLDELRQQLARTEEDLAAATEQARKAEVLEEKARQLEVELERRNAQIEEQLAAGQAQMAELERQLQEIAGQADAELKAEVEELTRRLVEAESQPAPMPSVASIPAEDTRMLELEGFEAEVNRLREVEASLLQQITELKSSAALPSLEDPRVAELEAQILLLKQSGGGGGAVMPSMDGKETEQLAFEDNLTRLPNFNLLKRYLDFSLKQVDRYQRRCALVHVDLDRFQALNEALGAEAGDEVLRQVAERLQKVVRTSDVLCRKSEDDFLILLSEVAGDANAPESISIVLKRIQEMLAPPMQAAGQPILISASIGVSQFPSDADTPEKMLMHAYNAMRRSKELGRNQAQFYTEELQKRHEARSTLEAELRKGLEARQFQLLYQPIVHLPTGGIKGVEALLRWSHPSYGVLTPDYFIEVADETGILVPLGRWVINQAAHQLYEWSRQGLDLFVTVNLSARQFLQADLVDTIRRALESTGAPAHNFVVEVPESVQMLDIQRVQTILLALRQAGVRVALDRFGSGFSSLERLHSELITLLKVDRKFLFHAATNAAALNVTVAALGLARGLRLRPVAVGVENATQLSLCRQLECEYVQGNLVYVPTDAAQISELARAGRLLR